MARYWVWWTGNWSDATNHWATTSGGAPWAGNLPTATDDVIFDTLSHTTSYTVTIDTTTASRDLTFWAPLTGNVTWTWSNNMAVSGSMALYSGLTRTWTGGITFNATSWSRTITFAGVTMASSTTFNWPWWTFTLQDTWNNSGSSITFTQWTVLTWGNAITCGAFQLSGTSTKSVTLSSSTIISSWNVNFAATTWLTFNAGTSTISMTWTTTFTWWSLIWNNLNLTGTTWTNTIVWDNTFNEFKNLKTWANTVKFTAGSTNTFTLFTVSWTAGNLVTIDSTTTATHALVKAGWGTVSSNYLNIQHSVATPSSTWYAWVNSTDNQAVATAGSGWIFTAPPTPWWNSNFLSFM